MGEKPQKIQEQKHISLGVLAHVDAGKTTLSEGLLFKCGRIRKIGRVDHKDAYLDTYDLVIHCGGCTLNRREMKNRIARVKDAGVPIVNYGIFIAATQGILKRTLEPFEEASRILNEI